MVIDVTARYPLASVWWRGEYTSADITLIAIHHTAMGELPADASEDDELAVLDCIYAFHVNTRGFGGIGYHGIAFPSGRTYLTCPLTRWGAHVALENDHLWGFSAAGDYTNSVPPNGTLRGLRELVALADRARAAWLALRPHLFWGGTTCPGARWPEWVPQLRKEDTMLTPAEREELDQVKANITTIYAQVDMIRRELGYGPQFGPVSQAPISPLRQNLQTALDKIESLEERPTGGTYTDTQAVNAVKDKLS